jgi:hypothetical protein
LQGGTQTKEKRMSMKIVAVMGLSMLCGCAGLPQQSREPTVERLDEHGLEVQVLMVEAGSMLRFLNADARPHQIYSNDCSELSSTLLNPGDSYSARLGAGPKTCHFQDLLAPVAASYSGTLKVRDADEQRRGWADFRLGDG